MLQAPPRDRPESSTLVEMVFPEQSNHYGTLFAGAGLSMMAKAAYITASRFSGRNIVLAASENIRFGDPVAVGAALCLTGTVVRKGRCSMTVEVVAEAEDLLTGTRRPAITGRFEMVAVGSDGRPTPIRDAHDADAQTPHL
ncbi:acyl-CoA thioesterase [Paracoccus pacificus]|uniref:Acyl-CoA thioesterase n=1 Tax=Paracoccus pacificus TaxID=1463598 RepID=A0ABW4R7S5_9RHOB